MNGEIVLITVFIVSVAQWLIYTAVDKDAEAAPKNNDDE